jgi:CheY-like chemotaxis protein/HPt (histidine-containing phosphotransfer) domain-containing protein
LRVLARRAGSAHTRFFLLGSGYRRRPRVEAEDLVLLDYCGMTRRSLYRALALASGRLSADGASEEIHQAPVLPVEAVAPKLRAEELQILVAEDNETNRKVIEQQLHVVGFDADFAEDGQQALEMWRWGRYGLLLTDLHMPRMDGYALAAAIRAQELAQDLPRTAIVALTANALRDEELRCRAAGIDAYLSKPIRLARLQEAIAQWLPRADKMLPPNAVEGLPRNVAPHVPMTGAAVDLAVLKALIGDDEAQVASVLRIFRATAAESSAALTSALATRDLHGAIASAHKFKSGARAIGALRLGQRCDEIELAAQAGRHDEVARLVQLFQTELDAVYQALEAR